MCGLFGVLLCCVKLYEGMLCVGGCRWRVGVATCQFRGLGRVCSWGWDMLVAKKICYFGDFPSIGRVYVICASDLPKTFQKRFESFRLICL